MKYRDDQSCCYPWIHGPPTGPENSLDERKLAVTSVDALDIQSLHLLLGDSIDEAYDKHMKKAELIQVALYEGRPVALMAWGEAQRRHTDRDRWLRWPDGLAKKAWAHIVRCLHFEMYDHCDQAEKILSAMVYETPYHWLKHLGWIPVLAEVRWGTVAYREAFEAAGWFTVSPNKPYKPNAGWLYKLDHMAAYELATLQLSSLGVLPWHPPKRGKLPLSRDQLTSLRHRLNQLCGGSADGVEGHGGGLLAGAFVAVVCGNTTRHGPNIYRLRLTDDQISLLGLESLSNYDIKEMLHKLCEKFTSLEVCLWVQHWLADYQTELPAIFRIDLPCMRSTMQDLSELLDFNGAFTILG